MTNSRLSTRQTASVQSKLTFSFVVLSIIAAIAFAVNTFRDQQRLHLLSIVTGSRDGEYFAFAQALAKVVAQHQPTIRIQVLESEGSRQNLDWLEQGKAQLAIVQSDTPSRPGERAVAYLFPEVFHLVARPGSRIQRVGDLQGKRVGIMPKGSGAYSLFWEMGNHYGLTPTNFTPVILAPEQAYQALQQGRIDAFFRVMALDNPALGNLLRTTRAQLVPIEQAEALRLSLPYLEAGTIPKGTYDGANPLPAADLPTVGVRAVLVTHEQIDPNVIRAITQSLFDFRSEIVALYPRAASMRLPDARENLGLPLHPGAKAYYNEDKPSFFVEYADSLGLLLSIGALVASGVWQFHIWLNERQKNRADRYNLEILNLVYQVESLTDLGELEVARQQLFEILRNVVVDLDKDRISPESFQSFAFPWEVAINTIRHREMLLLNLSPNLSPEKLSPEKVSQEKLPPKSGLKRHGENELE